MTGLAGIAKKTAWGSTKGAHGTSTSVSKTADKSPTIAQIDLSKIKLGEMKDGPADRYCEISYDERRPPKFTNAMLPDFSTLVFDSHSPSKDGLTRSDSLVIKLSEAEAEQYQKFEDCIINKAWEEKQESGFEFYAKTSKVKTKDQFTDKFISALKPANPEKGWSAHLKITVNSAGEKTAAGAAKSATKIFCTNLLRFLN